MFTHHPYAYDKDLYAQLPNALKLWLNKLHLAEALGYSCGPAGTNAPLGTYCVRPIMNMYGQGEGGYYKHVVSDANDARVPNQPGYFWVEWFPGKSKFTEYVNDVPLVTHVATVDQEANERSWVESPNHIVIPDFLKGLSRYMIIEAHDDKIIEVSFRLAAAWARRDVIADYQTIVPEYDPSGDIEFGLFTGKRVPAVVPRQVGVAWEEIPGTRVDEGK
jgi:hypothetical protein